MLTRAFTMLALLLPTIGRAETALQELERMERIWRDSGTAVYTFRPHGEYNLAGDSPPVVVKVRNGRVSAITCESPFGKYRAGQSITLRALRRMPPVPILTVEQFFAFIRAHFDPDQPAGAVRYHQTLGYPLSVYFDRPDVDDDEVLVQIAWLEVGK